MSFQVPCPHCGAALKSSQPLPVGIKVKCLRCRKKFHVTLEAASAASSAPAEEAFSFSSTPRPGILVSEPAPRAAVTENPFDFIPAPADPDPTPLPGNLPPLKVSTPGGNRALLLAVVGGGALLVISLIVTLLVLCLNSESENPKKETAGGSPQLAQEEEVPEPQEQVAAREEEAQPRKVIAKPAAPEPPPAPPKKAEPVAPAIPAPKPATIPGQAPEAKSGPVVVPPSKPEVEKSAEPEKQPEFPPPMPKVDPARLKGSVQLGPYLATAQKPKPLGSRVKAGLKWLASHQLPDGGWGDGGQGPLAFGRLPAGPFGARAPRRGPAAAKDQVQGEADVPNTCIAALALLRSGSSPAAGPYAANLRKAIDFVCSRVEKADATSLSLSENGAPPGPQGFPARPMMGFRGGQTLVQFKIGTNADTFLALLFLAEVRGRMPDELTGRRVEAALSKLVGKMEKNQGANGSWSVNGVGWAPVLGQALGTKAMNRARQNGAKVSEDVLEKAKKFASGSFDPHSGKFVVDGSAGVGLYSASANLAMLQDSVNTYKAHEKQVQLAAASGSISMRDLATTKLQVMSEAKKTNQKATKVVVKNLGNRRFLQGFGNNGGEEFLSYLNISEALAAQGGSAWKSWDHYVSQNVTRVQNKDGSWSGYHCITGRTFCTSAALLALMADRSPVPVVTRLTEK